MPKRFEQIVIVALVGLGLWLTVARAQTPTPGPAQFESARPEMVPTPVPPGGERDIDVLFAAPASSAGPVPGAAPPKSSVTFEPMPIDSGIPAPTSPRRMRQVRRFAPVEYLVAEPIPEAELIETQRIKALEPKLKLPKGEPAKEVAVRELAGLLEKSFDRDLERREKQILQVEERIKRLRDQIERRKTAKKEILNLRLQTMVNEAEGLGFPAPDGDGQLPTPTRDSSPFENPNDRNFRPTPAASAPWNPSPPSGVQSPTPADDFRRPPRAVPAGPPLPADNKRPPIPGPPQT